MAGLFSSGPGLHPRARVDDMREDSAYGAASRCEECSADDDSSPDAGESPQTDAGGTRRRYVPRPSFEAQRDALLEDDVLHKAFTLRHPCKNTFMCPFRDIERTCVFELYGHGEFEAQLKDFRQRRTEFLRKSARDRREAVYENMRLKSTTGDGKFKKRADAIEYLVNGRVVCRRVFRERFPISKSTLVRLEARLVSGSGPHGLESGGREHAPTEKRLQCIAWWLAYAEAMAERMPDVPHLYTPCRLMNEVYAEYKNDMIAAGRRALIVHPATFNRIYKNADELDHVTMSKLKRNFTRCDTCVDIDART
jgi:hypothetical protein